MQKKKEYFSFFCIRLIFLNFKFFYVDFLQCINFSGHIRVVSEHIQSLGENKRSRGNIITTHMSWSVPRKFLSIYTKFCEI